MSETSYHESCIAVCCPAVIAASRQLVFHPRPSPPSLHPCSTALIVLLVVEALVIQMSCLVYEWVLVQRLESSRLVAILAMLGLPGPILRQLATKEAKVCACCNGRVGAPARVCGAPAA